MYAFLLFYWQLVLSNLLPARLSKLGPSFNSTTSAGLTHIKIHSSLPLVAPDCEGLTCYHEEPLELEDDILQEYYQQAFLSDGLQWIDEWTCIAQDWDESFGVLKVSPCIFTLA